VNLHFLVLQVRPHLDVAGLILDDLLVHLLLVVILQVGHNLLLNCVDVHLVHPGGVQTAFETQFGSIFEQNKGYQVEHLLVQVELVRSFTVHVTNSAYSGELAFDERAEQ